MIKIGSRTGHKLGILLILTTLAIGSATAVSWNSPASDNEEFGTNEITLNVTEDAASYVDFWVKSTDDSNYTNVENVTSSTGDFFTYTLTQFGDGVYDIRANNSAGQQTRTGVVFDTQSPNLDSNSPTGFVGSDPEVSVSVSDSGESGIDYTYLNVSDSDGNDLESTQGTNLELSDLDDEEHTVDYYIRDQVGNWNNGSWTFTVDTEYDGDSNPSFTVEGESDGVVLFDEDKDLTVDFGDADSTSDTTVNCYVADEEVDSFTVSSGDDNPDESDTTCTIDEDDNQDYYDSSAEIYLEMEDEAGNTAESDTETVSFDVNPPSVTGLEIPTDANLYNSNFDVEFSAFDSASEVEEVEYYFDSSTSFGDGTEFESIDQDSYEIDTSDLEAGDQTLYVRARDEADRWSSPDSVDFSFDPEAVPEISLDVPENISVTAGQDGEFDVTIENTGELHISTIDLSASAEGVFSSSQSISDLEPGESVTVTLDVETEAGNIGEHTIEVSTDNPSMSEEIGLLVEANSDQQNRIDSDLSEYQSSLQELEANVTELRQKVSQEKRDRLDSNFTAFKDKVENAQAAVDRGDYYEAESILEGVDQDRTAAQDSYNSVKKEYQNNQFWMFIFLGVGGFLVLAGGAIAAVSYSDEVDFDVREYLEKLQQKDFDSNPFDKYIDKFKRMLEGKDTSDAEDFKWDGFDDN